MPRLIGASRVKRKEKEKEKKTSIQESKEKVVVVGKTRSSELIYFTTTCFFRITVVHACPHRPPKNEMFLKEECKERIAPQRSWIKVRLGAASLTAAGREAVQRICLLSCGCLCSIV